MTRERLTADKTYYVGCDFGAADATAVTWYINGRLLDRVRLALEGEYPPKRSRGYRKHLRRLKAARRLSAAS
jgi:glutathione S-transferase